MVKLIWLAVAVGLLCSGAFAQVTTTSSSGGGVTAVTATSPIHSSGGTTPVISCPTCSTGGKPGGSSTQGQYNNAGAFAGSSTFLFNVSTGVASNFQLSNAGVFTGSQQYIYDQVLVNSCSPSTEWYTTQSTYATEALVGCIANPSNSTAAAHGLAGFANGSNTEPAVGVVSSGRALVNGARAWGSSENVADVTGLTSNVWLTGDNVNVFANNSSSAYQSLNGYISTMTAPNTGYFGNGYACNLYSSTGAWSSCFYGADGAAVTGLQLGYQHGASSSLGSQTIQMNYLDSGGTEHSPTLSASSTGTLVWTGGQIVAQGLAPPFPVTPQCYFNLINGSGTTWPATVGGYTLTFASGGNAPSWNGTNGLQFDSHAGTWATLPAACASGAGTLIAFYRPNVGSNITSGRFANTAIIGTDTGDYLTVASLNPSQGPAWSTGYNSFTSKESAHATGPVVAAVTFGSGTSSIGIYGNPQVSIWNYPNTINNGLTATTTVYLGSVLNNPANSWSGWIQGFAFFSSVLTQAQIISAEAKMEADFAASGSTLKFVDNTDYSHGFVIQDGDSRNQGWGGYGAWASNPLPLALNTLGWDGFYYNVAHYGGTTNTINAEFPGKVLPLMNTSTGTQLRIVATNMGVNDISSAETNSTILANQVAYFTGVVSNSGCGIIETIAPDNTFNATLDTQRLTLNASERSYVIAGTYGPCVTLSDIATEPTIGNVANESNSLYWANTNHYTALASQMMVPYEALALHRLLRPQEPYWFMQTYIPNSFNNVASTTETWPVVQLLPGEQVCGVKTQVNTAFAGTSISALTISVGDSTGSVTQYQPSGSGTLNMLTTGSTVNNAPAYVTANGVVQANFSATGANLSAISAGNLTIEVEICGAIP